MRNIVGPKIKEARLTCKPKITQAQLAAKLQLSGWNIDRVGVAKIETGIKEVTDIQLIKLSKALNVSTSWLLGETRDHC